MNIIRYRTPELASWTPFNRLAPLRDLLESAYRMAGGGPAMSGWTPVLDVYEDADKVTVKVEVAGMKKDAFDIALEDGTLTVSGTRPGEASRASFRSERFFGSFSRSVTLPTAVRADDIQATYENGVLTVVLHKAEEAKPKKITIS